MVDENLASSGRVPHRGGPEDPFATQECFIDLENEPGPHHDRRSESDLEDETRPQRLQKTTPKKRARKCAFVDDEAEDEDDDDY